MTDAATTASTKSPTATSTIIFSTIASSLVRPSLSSAFVQYADPQLHCAAIPPRPGRWERPAQPGQQYVAASSGFETSHRCTVPTVTRTTRVVGVTRVTSWIRSLPEPLMSEPLRPEHLLVEGNDDRGIGPDELPVLWTVVYAGEQVLERLTCAPCMSSARMMVQRAASVWVVASIASRAAEYWFHSFDAALSIGPSFHCLSRSLRRRASRCFCSPREISR